LKGEDMAYLIDRQAVIDLLKKSASKDIEEVVVTEKNIKLIMDMPKAFDVDVVVNQLEEEREYAYADFDEYAYSYELDLTEEYDDFFHKGLERAMRIVKAGGING
jgi:oligoendopeptidase F